MDASIYPRVVFGHYTFVPFEAAARFRSLAFVPVAKWVGSRLPCARGRNAPRFKRPALQRGSGKGRGERPGRSAARRAGPKGRQFRIHHTQLLTPWDGLARFKCMARLARAVIPGVAKGGGKRGHSTFRVVGGGERGRRQKGILHFSTM
jgi:hypothetical protein